MNKVYGNGHQDKVHRSVVNIFTRGLKQKSREDEKENYAISKGLELIRGLGITFLSSGVEPHNRMYRATDQE